MRFVKRNWKTILSAVIVLLVIAAAIAGTSIHSVKDEQKRAMEALQPVEIGEEQILSEEEAATETAEAEQQKEEQKERLERKIESERSSYRYLNSRLRETEEELDRERGKSGWDKFREKHCMRFLKKRYRSCYYTKKSFADWFAEKMMFPLGCVIFAVAVFAILNYFDLIWYMW